MVVWLVSFGCEMYQENGRYCTYTKRTFKFLWQYSWYIIWSIFCNLHTCTRILIQVVTIYHKKAGSGLEGESGGYGGTVGNSPAHQSTEVTGPDLEASAAMLAGDLTGQGHVGHFGHSGGAGDLSPKAAAHQLSNHVHGFNFWSTYTTPGWKLVSCVFCSLFVCPFGFKLAFLCLC